MARASVGGYQLAYETVGSGPLPGVMHWGMLADRRHLLPLAERLSDLATWHVVDGRAYGESDAPTAPFTLDDYAADLARLVEALVGGPAVLVGQSMGAMTFLRLALARPDLVIGLGLIDTSAGPEDPERRPAYEALLDVLAAQGISDELLDLVAGASLMAPAFIAAHPDRVAGWRDSVRGVDVDAFIVHARAVFDRDDVRPRLGEITAPAVVVVGDQDTSTPPACAEELAAGLGGPAGLSTIPGAGHFAAWEQPDAVAAALRPWLQELTAAG